MKTSSRMYEFVLCSSLCAVATINLLVSNTTLWRLYFACWTIITPQTHALDQRYEDNDLHYLINSVHNGEWTGYNFGFMATLNNKGKSPSIGRCPNMGRYIISYQEVLSSLLKNVNHQADEAVLCNHSINGQLVRTSVLTRRVCFGAL